MGTGWHFSEKKHGCFSCRTAPSFLTLATPVSPVSHKGERDSSVLIKTHPHAPSLEVCKDRLDWGSPESWKDGIERINNPLLILLPQRIATK